MPTLKGFYFSSSNISVLKSLAFHVTEQSSPVISITCCINARQSASTGSREEYIRSIVMGGEVRARPCEHHTELLRKVSGLCNNANQLAHVANGCGMAGEESIREMLRMTKETWRLVKEEW